MTFNSNNFVSKGDEVWRCIYCGEKFTSSVALKIHFSQHNEKFDFSTDQCCCSCGKYFSEFHYFENHLLQTGHMNDSTCTILPPDKIGTSKNVTTQEFFTPRLSPVTTLEPRIFQNQIQSLGNVSNNNININNHNQNLNVFPFEGLLFIYGMVVTTISTGKNVFLYTTQ